VRIRSSLCRIILQLHHGITQILAISLRHRGAGTQLTKRKSERTANDPFLHSCVHGVYFKETFLWYVKLLLVVKAPFAVLKLTMSWGPEPLSLVNSMCKV